MLRPRRVIVLTGLSTLALSGFLIVRAADQTSTDPNQLTVEHPECSYFGPQREMYVTDALAKLGGKQRHPLSDNTARVAASLGTRTGSRIKAFAATPSSGSIDSYIFADLQKHGITPAPKTDDWEFVR